MAPDPGKSYNWLAYLFPALYGNNWSCQDYFITPQMAADLALAGFASKADVSNWLWQNSFVPKSQFLNYGWFDFATNSGNNAIPTWTTSSFQTKPIYPAPDFGPTYPPFPAGTTYNQVPDSGMLPTCGSPNGNVIMVTGGGEETAYELLDSPGGTSASSITPVDPWR
jgi:rubredoxin